jgi:hypothetical protein
LLTAASIGSLALFIRLLWVPGEPPAMLFAVLFQWVAVTTEVFLADWQGVAVNENAAYAAPLEATIWMALLGLVVLAVGLRLGRGHLRFDVSERVAEETPRLSIPRVAQLYAAGYLFSVIYPFLLNFLPPARQIFLAATDVRWVFFFLLAYLVFSRGRRWAYFWIPFGIEVIGGIGFFSQFKVAFFFAFIAVLFSGGLRLTSRRIAVGGVFVATLVVLGLFWTTIKGDLRTFLNQGTTTQSVRVSDVEKYRKFVDLMGEVRPEDLARSVEPMLERMAYVEIFSAAVDHVPDRQPHSDGEIWGNALGHIFKPRIFFPNKEPVPDDAVRTNRYTGLSFTTRGTSVSMGYMADSYIDFGPYFMYVPIFLLGLTWGLMYRFFIVRSSFILLGLGMSTVIMVQASNFGAEAIKLIGGTVLIFLVFATLMFLVERDVVQWMRGEEN